MPILDMTFAEGRLVEKKEKRCHLTNMNYSLKIGESLIITSDMDGDDCEKHLETTCQHIDYIDIIEDKPLPTIKINGKAYNQKDTLSLVKSWGITNVRSLTELYPSLQAKLIHW